MSVTRVIRYVTKPGVRRRERPPHRRGLRRPRRAEARRPAVQELSARGRPDVRPRRDHDRGGEPAARVGGLPGLLEHGRRPLHRRASGPGGHDAGRLLRLGTFLDEGFFILVLTLLRRPSCSLRHERRLDDRRAPRCGRCSRVVQCSAHAAPRRRTFDEAEQVAATSPRWRPSGFGETHAARRATTRTPRPRRAASVRSCLRSQGNRSRSGTRRRSRSASRPGRAGEEGVGGRARRRRWAKTTSTSSR